MDELPIGGTFAGYRIESVIGRGGMGVVYLAEHLRLKRRVALKVVAPEHAGQTEFAERFIREAQLAASLDHPSIIPVHDADEADGRLFIAMRYVPGTDLGKVLDRGEGLDPGMTLWILDQVGSALDAAHAQGLVHRDVKPANIVLGEPVGVGRVFLTDFGLTKRIGSETRLTRTGFYLGTLMYSAPEQLQGQPLDGRTDQYALAAVLYQCLSGRAPFVREMDAQVIAAHLAAEPPRVGAVRPDLPAGIDPVIARGMAKAKEDRFPSCAELLAAARAALAMEPAGEAKRRDHAATIAAPPPPPSPPAEPSPGPQVARSPLERGAPAAAEAPLFATAVGAARIEEAPTSAARPARPLRTETEAEAEELRRVPPARPESSRRRLALVAGGVLVTVAVLAVALLLINGGGSGGGTATITVGNGPSAATFGAGAVWIPNQADGKVSRIDPGTNQVTDTIPVGAQPGGATFAEGAVWIVNGDNTVSRIDPASNRVTDTIGVGARPVNAATGDGAVWVANEAARTISRIDTVTVQVTATIDVRQNQNGRIASPSFGAGTLWVMDNGDRTVVQIDPATNRVTGDPIEVGPVRSGAGGGLIASTFGAGALWVANSDDDTVSRIDPGTNRVTATIPLSSVPDAATFGAGAVWIAGGNEVSRIDPATNRVTATFEVGRLALGVAFGDGAVWTANHDDGTVSRIQS